MNQIIDINAKRGCVLPIAANEPAMSGSLSYALDSYAVLGDAALSRLSQADREEASRLMPYYDRASGPSRRDAVRAWLVKVASSVTKAPSNPELDMRVNSVMETSSDLCVAAWTGETRAQFSRGCVWWPSDSEIDKFLRPISNAIKAKRRALGRVVKDVAPAPAPVRSTPGREERAAVAEILANLSGTAPEPSRYRRAEQGHPHVG
jgi:hypothetical protein